MLHAERRTKSYILHKNKRKKKGWGNRKTEMKRKKQEEDNLKTTKKRKHKKNYLRMCVDGRRKPHGGKMGNGGR